MLHTDKRGVQSGTRPNVGVSGVAGRLEVQHDRRGPVCDKEGIPQLWLPSRKRLPGQSGISLNAGLVRIAVLFWYRPSISVAASMALMTCLPAPRMRSTIEGAAMALEKTG